MLLQQYNEGKNFIGLVPNYDFNRTYAKAFIKAQLKHLRGVVDGLPMYQDAITILEQAWAEYHEPQATKTQTKTTQLDVEIAESKANIARLKLDIEESKLRTEAAEARIEAARTEALEAKEVTKTLNIIYEEAEKQIALNDLIVEAKQKLEIQIRKRDQELNMDRYFKKEQRRAIYASNEGKCQRCGKFVDYKEFEADHIIPYSKQGPTTLENGQCLCRECNRAKGGN